MVTFERAGEILQELVEKIPEEFYKDLNGGVNLNPNVKISPMAVDEDLYIMGMYYRSGQLGRIITIYYGSFAQVYGKQAEEVWKKQLWNTLCHELTHHLESLAGEKDLEIEDRKQMLRYTERKGRGQQKP